jgi:hypothetical protein
MTSARTFCGDGLGPGGCDRPRRGCPICDGELYGVPLEILPVHVSRSAVVFDVRPMGKHVDNSSGKESGS